MSSKVTIIGIDCAVQPKNMGLAVGSFNGQTALIDQAAAALGKGFDVIRVVADRIRSDRATLLAFDAPLGWPSALGGALAKHSAGSRLNTDPNTLFRRRTDQVVRRELNKQSLDVGADRIARTAHAALKLLDSLRKETGLQIPLAWEQSTVSGVHAIEVYPAATLRAHGLPDSGYKGKASRELRSHILHQLHKEGIQLSESSRQTCWLCDDALDAVICILAGIDFLRKEVILPTDPRLARREGWIWVKRPG